MINNDKLTNNKGFKVMATLLLITILIASISLLYSIYEDSITKENVTGIVKEINTDTKTITIHVKYKNNLPGDDFQLQDKKTYEYCQNKVGGTVDCILTTKRMPNFLSEYTYIQQLKVLIAE